MEVQVLNTITHIVTTYQGVENMGSLLHLVRTEFGPGVVKRPAPPWGTGATVAAGAQLVPGQVLEWHPPAASTAAVMPQAEYLQVPMEDIKFKPGSTTPGSGTDAMLHTLSKWELDYNDIDAVLATSLGGKTITRPTAMPTLRAKPIYTSESETNELFLSNACKRINDVYAANQVGLQWKLEPASPHDNLKPDFVFRRPDDLSEPDVMVGEGKFPSVLDHPDLLAAVLAARHAEQQGQRAPTPLRQSLGCAVEQECGYMHARGARYGFLTCHRYTYFLKYVGFMHYAITDAVLATDTDPSVAAILYYLCEKSRNENPVDAGGENNALTTVPAPGSSGATLQPGLGGRPAKQARTGTAGSRQGQGAQGEDQHSAAPPSGASCSGTPCMIPDDALTLEGRLGEGVCGIVFLARLYGQQVALKSVDAYNSPHLVRHVQHEADVLSGRLLSLQGICIPFLRAYGYWKGRLMFALATSVIYGRHPEAGQESAVAKASAEKALQEVHAQGVAHGDIREENILVDGDDKVWFIDFGSSVVDPAVDVCTKELQELRLIFTASSSPDSDKIAHKHQ